MKKDQEGERRHMLGTVATGVAGIAAGAAAATLITKHSDTIKEMYHRVTSKGDALGKEVEKKVAQTNVKLHKKK